MRTNYGQHAWARRAWSPAEYETLHRYSRSGTCRPIFGAVTFRVVVTEDGLQFCGEMQVEPRDPSELPAEPNYGPAVRVIVHDFNPRTIRVTSDGMLDGRTLLKSSDPDYLFRTWLREQLHMMVTHEVDELLEVEGRRVFDPHERRPRMSSQP